MENRYVIKKGSGKPAKPIQLIYSNFEEDENEIQQYQNGTNADESETDSSTA